jgi:hypothetical protein
MAEITRVNGDTVAMEQIGRDIEFLTFTGTANTSDLDLTSTTLFHLEALAKIVAQYSTVTIIGTPTSTTVTLGVEGLGATTAELDTALETANFTDDGADTWVVASVAINGVTFA